MNNLKGLWGIVAVGAICFLGLSARAADYDFSFYPANDKFANRAALTGANAVAITDASRAMPETGEPAHGTTGTLPWKSLWWTWRAPFTGTVSFAACGLYSVVFPTSSDVASLDVYTGSELTALTKVASVEGDIGNRQIITASVAVTEGVDYQIALDNHSPWGYRLMLFVHSAPLIVSPLNFSQPVGIAGSYAIQARHGASTYGATGLPAGLTLDTATGVISGTASTQGQYTVTLSATNAAGTTNAILKLAITESVAPTITSPAQVTVRRGEPFLYPITASGGATSYGAQGLPAGLSVDTGSGVISGSILDSEPGAPYTVTLSATNAVGTGQALLLLDIQNVIDPPCLTSPSMATGTVGDFFRYRITATRLPQNGYSVSYRFGASNLPPGLSMNTVSGEISGTLTNAGVWEVPISAKNSIGTTTATLSIVARSVSAKPSITSGINAIGFVGMPFSYQVTADQAPTKIWANSLPPGLAINTVTGLISGTPILTGTYSPQFYADNAVGSGGDIPFTLMIMGNATGLPIITSPAEIYVTQGQPFAYQVTANNKVTSYGAISLPAGVSFDSSTGLLTGTLNSVTDHTIGLTLSNTYGNSWTNLKITVGPFFPSVTTSAATNPIVGTPFNYTLPFAASNFTGLPPGLTTNSSTYISGTPTATGLYPVKFTLNNDNQEGTVTMLVTDVATPLPVITSSAVLTAYVGEPFVYYIRASKNPTSYGSSKLPVGWDVDAATGRLSGTPTQTGTCAIPISATNASGTGQATLTLHVVNLPYQSTPRITSSAACYGVVNQPFYYKLTTNDHSILPSIPSLPAGLSYDPALGVISGIPTQIETRSVAVAFNNTISTYIQIIILSAAPRPPTITSAPMASGSLNVPFRYQIEVSDTLNTVYSASGLPAGLKVDTKSGLISGTPTTVGITNNIVISAINPAGNTYGKLRLTISSTLPPPVLTSVVMAEGMVGDTGTIYQPELSNPAKNFVASGLPDGVVMDATTGVMTGTPLTVGDYPVSLTAYDVSQSISSKVLLRIKASQKTLQLTSAASDRATLGQPYNFTFSASLPVRTIEDYGYNLPAGLALDSRTGKITGIPTESGTFPISVLMSSTNSMRYANFRLRVDAVANGVLISGPAGAVAATGETFSAVFSSLDAQNFTASNLPTGLTWAQASGTTNSSGHTPRTGTLSGVVTVPGFYQIPLTATNGSNTTTATLSLTVSDPQLAPPRVSLIPTAFEVVEGNPVTLSGTVSGFPTAQLEWTHKNTPIADASNSSLVLTAVVPADAGSYWISGTNACGKTVSAYNHYLKVLSTFNQWQARQFTPEQLADPAVSGPTAAPYGDNVPNLLKYALDLDPTRAVMPEDASAFPVSTVETGDTDYLALTYRQNKAATGIVYELQTSEDLLTWQTVTPDVSEVVGTDSTTGDSVVRKKVQLNGESKKFIRLKIVSP